MQQACSRCGYVSDRPARFCRQCGSQLFAENDVTSATTRNYSQQPSQSEQQPAEYAPGFSAASYAPGTWTEQTPNTSRLYQAPAVAQYPYPAVQQKKDFSWGKWILISFLSFLLLCVMAGTALFWWGKRTFEQALKDAGPGISEPGTVTVPTVADIPIPPEAPPAPSAGTAVNLEALKYPGATVAESTKAPFTEVIKLTTDDDLETVKQYYDKKFGELFKNSNTKIQAKDNEKYVYTNLSSPLITIELQPDPDDDAKTHISVTKVSTPFPKIVFSK